jgi:hypothetical protein
MNREKKSENQEKEISSIAQKVKLWEALHLRILLFFGSVNQFFSMILFVVYGMDFVVLLGFTANFVKNTRFDLDFYIFLIFSTIVFLSYGTVFLIPLVGFHEKVSGENVF